MQAEKSKRGMGWSRSVGQPVGVGRCGGMSFWVGVMWLQMMIGIGAWMVEAEEMRYELVDRRIEELMDSGQYQKAFAEYSTIDGVQLGEVPGYWLDYRKVDSHWRAMGSTTQRDNEWMELAEKDLTGLLERTYTANPGIEYIKAYIHESLGELKMRRYGVWSRDSWLADILSAMDYWAGAEPDDSSRARYLALARRVIDPMGGGEMISSYLGMRQSGVVYRIIEGAYRIADGLDEKGYFGMALAGYYRWSGDAREVDKAFRVLDRISAEVDEGVWHWRILYTKAQMLMSPGIPRRNAQGTWDYEVDYVGMVGLLEDIVRGDVDNSSGHVREAEELIKQTRSKQIMVHVDGIFQPGQKFVMDVVMRNAAKMDVRIVPLSFSNRLNLGTRGWTENGVSGIFSIPIKRPVYQAEIENEKFENHQAYTRKIEIEAGLEAGAYMVVVESGDQKIQELLLVTGAMGVSQVYSEGCSLLFADSISGKPLSGAQVKIVRGMRGQNSNMSFREYKFDVGESGILDLNKAKVDNLDQSEVLVLAETSHGPVVFQLYGMGARQSGLGSEAVKYYTFCDRPAYRPGDEVQWKVVVRRPDGGAYSVPAGMRVAYEIQSPRGDKVQEGQIDINNFGTGLGSLTLGQEATLGTYRILLKSKSDRYWVGNFPLFRLEEYKLPEFFVKVEVSGEGGGVSLPGEEIEMEVSAQYYYGAAVSGGEVEVIVKRRKWQYPWEKPMPYPWMSERSSSQLTYRGYMPGIEPSEEVYRTSLQTDAQGRARFTFETEDLEMGVDYEYTVEARVTDGSRVMVAGQGAVKVSEKPYFVSGAPEHVIHVPGDPVKIQWSFRDANQRPVSVKGRIQVALQKTIEVDVNQRPDGRMVFPPAKDIYEYEIVSMIDVETDGSGEYESLWRPEKKGFYRFKWIGDGVPAYLDPEYSVGVWVMGDDQETIGYRSGGVEIISDKKSVESGSEYTFVVAPAKPGGFVWLSYEVGNTWHDEIVPVEGNARVMKYKVGPDVSRNFFIHAVTVRDLHVYEDHEEVLVPPTEKILSMDIKPAEEVYRPGEQTHWTVTVLDSDGQPVMGELALSVYDKSIESIQKDYAGSIEEFFYSGKYFSAVSVNNMLSYKGYYIEPEEADGRNNIHSGDSRIMPVSRKLMRGAMPTPMMAAADSAVAGMVEEAGISSDPANAAAQPIVVRSNFRKTAFWDGQIITDQNGQARVSFVLPDSLTAWKAVGRFVDKQTAVAQGESEVQARNPLNVRLELPRFLVSGDSAVISAMVSNQTNEALDVAMDWELAGGWQPDSADHLHVAQKKIQPGEQVLYDLKVAAVMEGTGNVRVVVRAKGFTDAVEGTVPLQEHGLDQLVFRSGKRRAGSIEERIMLPSNRRTGSTSMIIRATPSLGMTLVDSLPYLINYPYGCIEQTMSRFMPAVVVKKTLMDLGFREADIVDAIAGGMDPGFIKSGRIKPGDGGGHLDAVIKASLERIYDFQKPGGGWGWWKEGQEDVYMSAYVVWGLAQAKSSGVEIDMASLERGRQYLQSILGRLYQDKDMLVWVMRSLALSREVAFPSTGISDVERSAFDEAWKSHLDFNAYTRSMLAVVAASCGEMEKARQLVLNLENGVIEVDGLSVLNRGVGDRGPRQVRWGKERMGMRWTDSAVESTSMAIEAMIRIHPQSELLEPAVNWLIANRRAANWNNTKDTAIAVLALSQYIRSAGEIFHPLDVSVRVNGQNIGGLKFRQDSALKGLIALEVPASLLEGDDIRIELIRSESEAPLYYNIEARYFSHEKPIQPSGNSLFITRDLNILESYPTLLKGYAERARFLGDYPKAASGDRVRVRIRIEAKADLEYVMIEDFKPACLEYESVQSGYGMSLKSVRMDHRGEWVSGGGSVAGVYHEWRDNRGVFFMDRLPEGIYELEYDARVQVPGTFSGLPGIGRAMYVPEIQGNSLEQSWSVIGSE